MNLHTGEKPYACKTSVARNFPMKNTSVSCTKRHIKEKSRIQKVENVERDSRFVEENIHTAFEVER